MSTKVKELKPLLLKTSFLLLNFSLLFTLCGCFHLFNTYEDLVPDQNSFGTWDGNYIYQGNMRTKTTGEDTEVLVREFDYEDKTYEVIQVTDYHFLDEKIYFFTDAKDKSLENEEAKSYFLLCYSLATEEVDIIYSANDRKALSGYFYYTFENYFVFWTYDSLEYVLLVIDINTKETSLVPTADEYYPLDDCIVMRKDSTLQYTKIDHIDLKTMVNDDYPHYKFNLIEKEERKYIRILSSMSSAGYGEYVKMSFYSLDDESLQTIYEQNDEEYIGLIADDYFGIREKKRFSYRDGGYFWSPNYGHEDLAVNMKLYRINFNNASFSCELIYTFDENTMYSFESITEDGNLVFAITWVRAGSRFFNGGVYRSHALLNIQTRKLSDYTPPKIARVYYSIEYSGVKYFIMTKSYGGLMATQEVYYLYSENLSTHEEVLLQFFAKYYGDINGTRYAEGFWTRDFNSSRFNTDNFLIRNY